MKYAIILAFSMLLNIPQAARGARIGELSGSLQMQSQITDAAGNASDIRQANCTGAMNFSQNPNGFRIDYLLIDCGPLGKTQHMNLIYEIRDGIIFQKSTKTGESHAVGKVESNGSYTLTYTTTKEEVIFPFACGVDPNGLQNFTLLSKQELRIHKNSTGSIRLSQSTEQGFLTVKKMFTVQCKHKSYPAPKYEVQNFKTLVDGEFRPK